MADESVNAPMNLETVCEKLDLLVLRHLELVQEYLDLSLKGEVYQKDGYLNLAKARYIQGPHSISKLSLPTEDSEEYESVLKVVMGVGVDGSNQDEDGTVKTRSLAQEPKSTCSENYNKLARQFGLLSSSSVKTAAKSFQQNLALCIERVNVMEEMNRVQVEFRSLQHVKNVLTKNELHEP